jgi:hypothetical protein
MLQACKFRRLTQKIRRYLQSHMAIREFGLLGQEDFTDRTFAQAVDEAEMEKGISDTGQEALGLLFQGAFKEGMVLWSRTPLCIPFGNPSCSVHARKE